MHEQVSFDKWGHPCAKIFIIVHVWTGGHGVNAMHGATLGIVAALQGWWQGRQDVTPGQAVIPL
jgi:hypothetical protein